MNDSDTDRVAPVTFRFHVKFNRKMITVSGVAGLMVLVGVLVLPHLFAASLDPARSEEEIRTYLKRQVTNKGMAELRAAGLSSPDAEMAARWEADLERIDRMAFVSVTVRRSLLTPPLSSSRMFMVRVVVRDAEQQERTRYFSLSAENKFFEFFWVAEQSRWMWIMSF